MKTIICRGSLAAAVFSVFLMGGSALADPVYHVSYLGYGFSNGLTGGINNSGQVVGLGGPSDLPPGSRPAAINDSGQVIGTLANHGFLYTNGATTDLGALPGYPDSAATAINTAGDVVGKSATANGSSSHAFFYHNGSLRDLGPGVASAINASGTIVGTSQINRAVVYQNGSVIDLGDFGDSRLTSATGINDLGQIVGTSYVRLPNNSFVNHPYVYESGVWHDLGLPTGLPLGIPIAINNRGEIVGNSNLSLGSSNRPPFVYTDGTIYNLDSLMDSSGAGLSLELAYDINDSGVILAEGVTQNDGYQAVLLTPVPLPTAIWPGLALLGGMAAVAALRRRSAGSP